MQKNNKPGDPLTLARKFESEPRRAERLSLTVDGLLADFSRRHADDLVEAAGDHPAASPGVADLFGGRVVNQSETRPALHWALRADPAELDPGIRSRCHDWRSPASELAEAWRSGRWQDGREGGPADVVCLGIGGSEVGTRLVVEALPGDGPRLHFLASVDGIELERLLSGLDPDRTAVLVTSKSFSTAETLQNAEALRDWLQAAGRDPARHMLGITARPDRAREFGLPAEAVLPMPEDVGGRFSLWSAAGLPILLAMGDQGFERLLAGARAMDAHFRDAPAHRNLPLILGKLDARSPVLAFVPYDSRLARLPEYLQQLYMESLGKGVDEDGRSLPDFRPPLVLGGTGTRAQHGFFQALHQANVSVTTEFLGVIRPGHDQAAHHTALLANMLGQATALAFGTGDDVTDPHRACPGNRESNVLLLDELTPESLGALLALYEHRVFVAARMAGVNPFDQFGVELGKRLAVDAEQALHSGGTSDLPPGLGSLIDRIRKKRA